MRVTSFLAIIEGNVAVSKNLYFILSVIHIRAIYTGENKTRLS